MKKIKLILLITIILLVILLLVVINKKFEKEDSLSVSPKETIVNISGIDKNEMFEETITIKNNSNDDIIYTINWENVENKYTNQSDLLYTITGEGEGTRSIGNSQIPVADFSVLERITIGPGKEHKYKVKVIYEKSNDSTDTTQSSFKGNLIVNIQD